MEDDEQKKIQIKCNMRIGQLIEQSVFCRESLLLYDKVPPNIIDSSLALNYKLRELKENLMPYQDKLQPYQLNALDYAEAIIDDNIQYLQTLKEQGEA